MQDTIQHVHSELTETILGCCFDVMNELGIGFLELDFVLFLGLSAEMRCLQLNEFFRKGEKTLS